MHLLCFTFIYYALLQCLKLLPIMLMIISAYLPKFFAIKGSHVWLHFPINTVNNLLKYKRCIVLVKFYCFVTYFISYNSFVKIATCMAAIFTVLLSFYDITLHFESVWHPACNIFRHLYSFRMVSTLWCQMKLHKSLYSTWW